MIEGYIGEMDTVPGAPYDGFISLNYLEHLPYPGEIIQKVYNQTTPDAVGYVTVPNLEYLLETKCFYEFVADHLSYFTKSSITHAFESNGFDVLECYTINNDNDIVAIVKKRPLLSIKDQYQEVESLIKDYQDLFAKYKKHNKKIAVWGAGHRTLALLALAGLENLEYVVDSASFKQGKFTPVLHSKIVPPDHLRENPVDLVIVMVPGLYPDEVLKTLRKMDLDTEIATLKDNKLEFE
jgi:hypothetical protein